jgi:hypothetical protein
MDLATTGLTKPFKTPLMSWAIQLGRLLSFTPWGRLADQVEQAESGLKITSRRIQWLVRPRIRRSVVIQ